jgi:hypothetical protein
MLFGVSESNRERERERERERAYFNFGIFAKNLSDFLGLPPPRHGVQKKHAEPRRFIVNVTGALILCVDLVVLTDGELGRVHERDK